jgi:transcriptional regulator NrdR family protein
LREEVEAMRCPYCNSNNIEVYDGRHKEDTYVRYRKCRNCFRNFKTVERVSERELKKAEVTA